MTGPIGTALAKTGIPAAIEAATDFLEKLAGPAAEETGLLLADKVREYRLNNQLRILGRAQEKLTAANIDPQSIPLRTLVPLLEGASLEDDETLSEMWASLLASAASGDDANPAFPEILRQLAPRDARLLSQFDGMPSPAQMLLFSFADGGPDWDVHVQNLVRLALVELRGYKQTTGSGPSQLIVQRPYSIPMTDNSLATTSVFLTPLGRGFMKACAGPAKGPQVQ